MKNDNRGLSLVELIIAFGILTLVSAMLAGFMSSGSRLYNSVSKDISLQVNGQAAMTQMCEYVIDCNGGITFENNSLYVINRQEGGFFCHIFALYGSEILYSKEAVDLEGGGIENIDAEPLTVDVTLFNVDFTQRGEGALMAELTLSFEDRGKSANYSQTLHLRNVPLYKANLSALLEAMKGD